MDFTGLCCAAFSVASRAVRCRSPEGSRSATHTFGQQGGLFLPRSNTSSLCITAARCNNVPNPREDVRGTCSTLPLRLYELFLSEIRPWYDFARRAGTSSPQAARIMRLTVGDKLGHASIRRAKPGSTWDSRAKVWAKGLFWTAARCLCSVSCVLCTRDFGSLCPGSNAGRVVSQFSDKTQETALGQGLGRLFR
jgi:hypothetical protein